MNVLAVLAVLLSIAQAPVPTTGKTADRAASHNQGKNQQTYAANSASAPSDPPPFQQAIRSQPAKPSDQSGAKEEKRQNEDGSVFISEPASMPVAWGFKEWITWGVNPAWFIVGVGGICVAIRTLKTVRRQTEANMIAAKASLKQAEHLMISSRAWLLIEDVEVQPLLQVPGTLSRVTGLELSFCIRNYGTTPAKVTTLACSFAAGGHEPPHPEIYDSDKAAIFPHVIPQGQFRDDYRERITQWPITGKIWASVLVRYEDVFGNEHMTCICYSNNYQINASVKVSVGLDGPPNYNQAT